MIIKYKKENILESKVEALVNPVNCVGVMGAGLAKQFKKKFPNMFNHYRTICFNKSLNIGKIDYYKEADKIIFNFPTKIHWKDKSLIEYIDKGLNALISIIEELDIKSVAVPMLGCGLGGLNKQIVHTLIVNKFTNEFRRKNLLIEIYL